MTPRAPEVSVILPCRDRPALLLRALASVRAQSFPDWEAIVADDASPVPLGPVAAGLGDPRIRTLRLDRNLGPAGAREAALAQARGRWAALLDSDDVWRPEKLARQLARMAEGPPRVLVAAAEVHGPRGARVRPARATRPGERIASFLYRANQFAQASGVLAPLALARAAGFGGLHQYEDHFHLIRAEALGAPVEVAAEPLFDQTDDAPDRLGARDDPARARAFLAAAAPMLTRAEAAGFALRCLGPALAEADRPAALRLALRETLNGGPPGAAAKLILRAAAGGPGYDRLRAAVKASRSSPSASPRAARPRSAPP